MEDGIDLCSRARQAVIRCCERAGPAHDLEKHRARQTFWRAVAFSLLSRCFTRMTHGDDARKSHILGTPKPRWLAADGGSFGRGQGHTDAVPKPQAGKLGRAAPDLKSAATKGGIRLDLCTPAPRSKGDERRSTQAPIRNPGWPNTLCP